MKHVFCLFILFALAGDKSLHKTDVSRDDPNIAGSWIVVNSVAGDVIQKDDIGTICQFKDNKIIFIESGKEYPTDLTLDTSKSPKWIDWQVKTSYGSIAVVRGIYKCERDLLIICIQVGTLSRLPIRPDRFETTPTGPRFLLTLSRWVKVKESEQGKVKAGIDTSKDKTIRKRADKYRNKRRLFFRRRRHRHNCWGMNKRDRSNYHVLVYCATLPKPCERPVKTACVTRAVAKERDN